MKLDCGCGLHVARLGGLHGLRVDSTQLRLESSQSRPHGGGARAVRAAVRPGRGPRTGRETSWVTRAGLGFCWCCLGGLLPLVSGWMDAWVGWKQMKMTETQCDFLNNKKMGASNAIYFFRKRESFID